ncbi:MAG: single-stranded-DNA-specific exonuclease RecJ, partial [Oscillospiraceae bacterium]|nr:single-stranded-DNA-specific exonuclease RecJ [Oscillospiraceae bacterium]
MTERGERGTNYTDWSISGYDRPAAVSLCRAGFNPLVATVLSSRGILTPEEAVKFTESGTEALPDPMLITGMDRASERLKRAIAEKEPVAVFGDYDVDGITASCILVKYLRSKGLSCRLIIPECREDGYGLSEKTVDDAAASGIKLGVTVDCGITSVNEAEYAASLGMDIIITDHHECGLKTPRAVAVADPKIPGCRYPCKHLAGVGVAFSLVCACEGDASSEKLLEEYSDLVALGTVADVMPVTGANRILVKKGLEVMRKGLRPGIACLARASGIDISAVTASVIGFSLGPRLNAAGRMGETSLAVKLMLSESEEEAETYAAALCEKNTCRRALECEMFEEALSLAENQPKSSAPLVVASENWHLGVAGIVASRLVEKLYRPAVVICVSDGVGRGSCRSVKGYSIHAALEA